MSSNSVVLTGAQDAAAGAAKGKTWQPPLAELFGPPETELSYFGASASRENKDREDPAERKRREVRSVPIRLVRWLEPLADSSVCWFACVPAWRC
jgi:hypothetical protein